MCIYRKFKITFYPEYKKKPENKQISAGDFSIERMEAHERIYFENRESELIIQGAQGGEQSFPCHRGGMHLRPSRSKRRRKIHDAENDHRNAETNRRKNLFWRS